MSNLESRCNQPIFIVGTERSGSNLLRLILNAHSNILVPHPPHILRYFSALEGGYGDLNNAHNFEQLVDEVLLLVKTHIYPWESTLRKEAIIDNCQAHNTFAIFTSIYDQVLAASGKQRWGCKSTFMIHHCATIVEQYPQAKLIWLIRDPRDVAVSSMSSVFNPFHPYFTGQLWQQQQSLGIQAEAHYGSEFIKRVYYEDLIAQPNQVIEDLCDFLVEPFEPSMLAYSNTAEAQKSSQLSESWINSSAPVLNNNSGKYLRDLSLEQIQAVEAVAGDMMAEMNYDLDPSENIKISLPLWQLIKFRFQDVFLNISVQWRSIYKDKNVTLRFQRGCLMAYLYIKRRLIPQGRIFIITKWFSSK